MIRTIRLANPLLKLNIDVGQTSVAKFIAGSHPDHLIHDRDACYGEVFVRRVRSLEICDQPISARLPWGNGHAEWLIGSIRKECLDHIVVVGERHLRHVLLSYMECYNGHALIYR